MFSSNINEGKQGNATLQKHFNSESVKAFVVSQDILTSYILLLFYDMQEER